MNQELVEAAYKEITVNLSVKAVEIKHPRYGSISVYRPQRESRFDSERGDAVHIKPGHINASSWNIGYFEKDATAQDIHLGMLIALRVWSITLRYLNEFNEVLPDWEPVRHVFYDAEEYPKLLKANLDLRQQLEALQANKKKRK